jgi:glutamate-5-semialdehyde dehydrogenase
MTPLATAHPATTLDRLTRAQQAAPKVARLSGADKDEALLAMAFRIAESQPRILAANRADLAAADLSPSGRDRLLLNERRIADMVDGIRAVVDLPDPVGEVVAEWSRPNGLRIRKVRIPLGVVAVIYESRPNVTVDAAVLAFKAGNAVVLRGGREAANSNELLVELLNQAVHVPPGAIELLDSRTRESVDELIRARGLVDVLIPRGGPELIAHVTEKATVPLIETGAGNCHVYVDKAADLDMADRIVLNAKTQRPSVCNAAEKLLIHRDIAAQFVPRIVERLLGARVEVRGDDEARRLARGQDVRAASPQDWSTEYLGLCIAVAVVGSLEEAIDHINRYSTKHSETIVTRDEGCAQWFLNQVDSAAVYWNASTRFTDGGEFGLGAEMGISTQKLHCRGPFGLVELTSTKYQILGSGQVRG